MVFKAFLKQSGLLRQRWVLSKNSSFIPPSVRGKMRFANLFPLIEWAKKHLDNPENIPCEIKADLAFLNENKDWVFKTIHLFLKKKCKKSCKSDKLFFEI